MDIKQLEYLIAVADNFSMHAAADALHVSQQNISRTIKQLEDELHITIFDRTTTGCTLTDDGRNLYQKARPLVAQFQEIVNSYHQDAPPPTISGSLQLYFSEETNNMTDFYCLPFLQQYPQIKLSAIELKTAEIVARITSDEQKSLAFLLISMEKLIQQKSILSQQYHCYLINNEPLRVVMSKNNPYATRSSISLRKLSKLPFVTLSSSFEDPSTNIQTVLDLNIPLNISYCSNSVSSLRRYLIYHMAFSLSTKTQFIKQSDSDLVSVPIKEKIYIAYCFLVPKTNITPPQQAFYDIFLATTPATTQKLF